MLVPLSFPACEHISFFMTRTFSPGFFGRSSCCTPLCNHSSLWLWSNKPTYESQSSKVMSYQLTEMVPAPNGGLTSVVTCSCQVATRWLAIVITRLAGNPLVTFTWVNGQCYGMRCHINMQGNWVTTSQSQIDGDTVLAYMSHECLHGRGSLSLTRKMNSM